MLRENPAASQYNTWGSRRVKVWEKRPIRAETSVQETEPREIFLWLPSQDGLQRGDFQESEVV